MPRAYIRQGLLLLDGVSTDGDGQIAPDAGGAVKAFRACGWDVVVLGSSRDPALAGVDAAWRDTLEARDPGAWLLTDQVADDLWARALGLRTALVGPTAEQPVGPCRCDVAYRDLRTAALEILSASAGRGERA